MGTKMGPSFANVFIGYLEKNFLIALQVLNLFFTCVTLMTF